MKRQEKSHPISQRALGKFSLLLLVSAWLVALSACHPFGKKRPSIDEIRGAVSQAIPPYFSVTEIIPEYLPGSQEGHWAINVKATLVPKTDLLARPTDSELMVIQEIDRKQSEFIGWRNQFLRGKPPEDFQGMKTEMEDTNIPGFVALRQSTHDTIPVYGRMTADWQVDRWAFGTQLDLPATGLPINQFSTAANTTPIVLGSPEAKEVIKNLREMLRENEQRKQTLISTYEGKAKERTEKAEAARQALQTKIRTHYAQGTKFKTPYHLKNRTITAVIEVLSYNTGNDTFEAVAYDEADPSFKKAYLGTISRDERTKEITEEGVTLRAVGKDGPLPLGLNTPPMFEATENSMTFRYSGTNGGMRGGVSNIFKGEDLFLKREGNP